MKQFALISSFVLLCLAGCATNPLPPDYTGPVAVLLDNAERESTFRAAFFYVAEVNGKPIPTSLEAARRVDFGKGFQMSLQTIRRGVPAGVTTLKLEGRHAYGAPIQEIVMAATMRSVVATIEVDLKPNVMYQVHGTLAEGNDAIWLEEFGTGERVGRTVNGK